MQPAHQETRCRLQTDERLRVLQHYPSAADWCWGVPLQTDHRQQTGGVPANHHGGRRSGLIPASDTWEFCIFLNCGEPAGLPTFIRQPEDQNVTRNAPFTLTCEAVGPPDPVQIRWLRDGLANSEYQNSSSSLSVSGENQWCVISVMICVKADATGRYGDWWDGVQYMRLIHAVLL